MLKIAIPNKGRLYQDTRALMEEAGLEVRALSDRALSASLGGEFEALFVRAQDIPELVADGAADLGITGYDLIAESERGLSELLDLEYGACRLVVAASEERNLGFLENLPPDTKVATVFPNSTRRFFTDRKLAITLVPMSGAVEIAPHLGIADVIVDLTATGSTLRSNGLREVATIFESTARLIARTSMSPAQLRMSDELVTALTSVLKARGQRYLMANVPRDRLAEVKEVLPGLNGPTVIDILNGGRHVAVHAVVAARTVYRTISELKNLGAEGILVSRIERLMS